MKTMQTTTDTRSQLLADLHEAISTEDGALVGRLFDRLVFLGASPGELRGVSDAGLSDDELRSVCPLMPSDSPWWESILNTLCPEFAS